MIGIFLAVGGNSRGVWASRIP